MVADASDGFFNTSWIYGQLQNFGGKPGIYGRLDVAARSFPDAYAQSSSLEGIGTASEAIEQNPVAVDIISDNIWSMPEGITNVSKWVREYVQARYPAPVPEAAQVAWEHLHRGVYSCDTDDRLNGCRSWNCVAGACTPCNGSAADGCSPDADCGFPRTYAQPDYVHQNSAGFTAPGMALCQMPARQISIRPGVYEPPWVCTGNPDDRSLGLAWENLLAAAATNPALGLSDTFGYDLVVVTAQALNMVFWDCHNRTVHAMASNNISAIKVERDLALGLILDLDELLQTKELFLLGTWLEQARRWGNSTAAYHASCDAPEQGRTPCTTGAFARAGRTCGKVISNCTVDSHCATCVAGGGATKCLTCKVGYGFFDLGQTDCTGSCGNTQQTTISADDCEFQGCCFDQNSSTAAAACYARAVPLTPEALFTMDAKSRFTSNLSSV